MLFSEPLLTYECEAASLVLEAGWSYLHAVGPEERSLLDPGWMAQNPGIAFIEVSEEDPDELLVGGARFALRDAAALEALMRAHGALYLDITGMTYPMWAPMVHALCVAQLPFRVVYREPSDYRRSQNPARGMIYDLSEGIAGIGPLPGLAKIASRPKRESLLVPLLGFEGARLAHVLETMQPDPHRIIPVLGVPGFRAEFPAQALIGNRIPLSEDHLASRMHFAKANCPFELFHVLHDIQSNYVDAFLRVAPIGTKPHGLGAVLYAISRMADVEIVYDHPKRRQQRTQGQSRVCLYEVGQFVESDLFQARGEYKG